jgi:hypothetical protein
VTKPRPVFGKILPILSGVVLAGGAAFALAAGTRAGARAGSSAPAAAVHGNAFTLDHLLTLRTLSDLTWSADGRRLASLETLVHPQSQELYTALRTLGVPVEFVHYPREGARSARAAPPRRPVHTDAGVVRPLSEVRRT